MAGCLRNAFHGLVELIGDNLKVFLQRFEIAGIMLLYALGGQVPVGDTAEYMADFVHHYPEAFHQMGGGIRKDTGFVLSAHFGKRA